MGGRGQGLEEEKNKKKEMSKREHFSTLFLFAFYWEILSDSIAQQIS